MSKIPFRVPGRRLILGFIAFLCFGGWVYRCSIFRVTQNFYEVDPGRFYRSGQLTGEELEEMIDRYGIKTVVSLRGAPEHAFWYKPEVETLSKKGVQFRAVWWTSEYFPPQDGLLEYLDILEKGPYPILVHCRTGADRTGEATAIYAIDHMHEDRETAIRKHLSIKYWHVELFKPNMVEFVRRYQGAEWAKKSYNLCSPELRPFAGNPLCP